ncbi:5-formyltetrahydrofolate cyclo-ligase [Dysgonomonas sp. OttesenSCG-928-M03]|nr:5-formyltetrahydrofolate cyclo-ligase [Dysgonomonas sp. OttesenSCG-928-M03]
MNSKNSTLKDKIRKEIADIKRKYTQEDLLGMSEEVFSVLEITGVFNDSRKICIYNAMNDEVATRQFIDRWIHAKEFYLPVVKDNDIILRRLQEDTVFEKSKIGVFEPLGNDFTEYSKLDIIIVPGVAFDRKGNRLGRGKGYYDRFLNKVKATKIGICFDFQLLDQIPSDNWDIKMDMIVSENDLIW